MLGVGLLCWIGLRGRGTLSNGFWCSCKRKWRWKEMFGRMIHSHYSIGLILCRESFYVRIWVVALVKFPAPFSWMDWIYRLYLQQLPHSSTHLHPHLSQWLHFRLPQEHFAHKSSQSSAETQIPWRSLFKNQIRALEVFIGGIKRVFWSELARFKVETAKDVVFIIKEGCNFHSKGFSSIPPLFPHKFPQFSAPIPQISPFYTFPPYKSNEFACSNQTKSAQPNQNWQNSLHL